MSKKAKEKEELAKYSSKEKLSHIWKIAKNSKMINEDMIEIILQKIFTDEKNPNIFIFPNIKRGNSKTEFNFIVKFIELLEEFFKHKESDRFPLYNSDIKEIKDKYLGRIINELKKLMKNIDPDSIHIRKLGLLRDLYKNYMRILKRNDA